MPIPGYMVALWMIGFEERPEQSAEICICEIFGNDVGRRASKVGYGIRLFSDPSITNDFHKSSLEFDAATYHVYAAEWKPTHVEFFIDNVSLITLPQSPRYPMQFMLSIYEIPDQLKPVSLEVQWPKALEVDYVRGYQPIAGY
jgi:beta-glucanase (GH16 family)